MTPVDSLLNLFESHKRQSAGALPIQAVIVSNDRMAASIRARSLGIERWSLIEPDVYIALLKQTVLWRTFPERTSLCDVMLGVPLYFA